MPPKRVLPMATHDVDDTESKKHKVDIPQPQPAHPMTSSQNPNNNAQDNEDKNLPICKYGSQCYRKVCNLICVIDDGQNPLHFKQFRHPKPGDLPSKFPTAFDFGGDYGDGDAPKTNLELRLMGLSQTILSKPDWFTKLNNADIRQKWTKEAKSQGASAGIIKYVFEELEQYYAKLVDLPILPSPVDGVYQADELIDSDLKKKLIQQVAVLEKVPEKDLDWHPGSDNQVLDLIHPSLFCLVQGTSRKVDHPLPWSKFLGAGSVINDGKKQKTNYSVKYQWLPSEFSVDGNGKASIDSYINNLHPYQHGGLYKSIGSIFERFVPLFSKVLSDMLNPRPNRIPSEIRYKKEESYDEDEEDDDMDAEEMFRRRGLIHPKVPPYQAPNAPAISFDLKGKNVQVIVKIASILLTPDKPSYDGGVWHIEGMENERIVATGIYYFTSENISESILEFRRAIREPDYEQNDSYGVGEIFDLQDEVPLNQPAGFVVTQEDRCIAFPNLYQHKVAPFSLKDKKKPGYRKILVFFLVDPMTPIVSTATIPPQQKSWFATELKTKMKGTWFSKLPSEILDVIVDYLDWPMDLESAKVHREALMKERKYFIKQNTEEVFERPFSLCEH